MIFIVDDDHATRDSLRLLLETEGFEAKEFAGGRPFLDGVRPVDGDCLILDLHMPGMSGLEVLEELRRRGDRLPVIIVSGHLDGTSRTRALVGGALAVIEKPHKADELLALLRTAAGAVC
jgi:two-component system, LuxR family, response regulator FixJ